MADKFAALSEGTYIKDAFEPALEAGVTLNAAGTTSGTIIDCMRPMRARIVVTLGTVTSTGNTATADIEIKASNVSDFSDANDIVSLGRFSKLTGTDAAQSALIPRHLDIYNQKRYLRATVILAGTAPSYAGTTIRVREERHAVKDTNTA